MTASKRPVPPHEYLLTPGEVAGLLGISPKAVLERAGRRGLDPVRTPGGHRRYSEAEVAKLKAAVAVHEACAGVTSGG